MDSFKRTESKLHKYAKLLLQHDLQQKLDSTVGLDYFYYAGFEFPTGQLVEELEVRNRAGKIMFVPDLAIVDANGHLRCVIEIVYTHDVSDFKLASIVRSHPHCTIYKMYATQILGGDSEEPLETYIKIWDLLKHPREGYNFYNPIGNGNMDVQALLDVL